MAIHLSRSCDCKFLHATHPWPISMVRVCCARVCVRAACALRACACATAGHCGVAREAASPERLNRQPLAAAVRVVLAAARGRRSCCARSQSLIALS